MGYDFSKLPTIDNNSSFWSPKGIGEALAGTLVGVQYLWNDGYAGSPGKMVYRFSILTEDGQTIMNNAPSLERQMQTVALGQYVKVVHEGLKQSKKGVNFRSYVVQAAPGAVNEEWLAKNKNNIALLDARLKVKTDDDEEVNSADQFSPRPVSAPTPRAAAEDNFNAALDAIGGTSPADKRARIVELAIAKLGAKSAEEAEVKVIMNTQLPMAEAYYDQILAKLK